MRAAAPVDLESGIVNLEEIEKNTMMKLAHGRWRSLEAKLNERIAHDRSQVSNLTNEIYQLLGFVSAFQGLLLTAVAQASQLKVHNVGIPLALSLFAAGVWQKKGIITELKRTLSTNKRVQELRLQTLEQEGNTFDFKKISPVPDESMAAPAGTCSSKWVTYNMGLLYASSY
jgi:hypothetical protein